MSGRFAGSIELRFVAATTIILELAIATVTFLHIRDTANAVLATETSPPGT